MSQVEGCPLICPSAQGYLELPQPSPLGGQAAFQDPCPVSVPAWDSKVTLLQATPSGRPSAFDLKFAFSIPKVQLFIYRET